MKLPMETSKDYLKHLHRTIVYNYYQQHVDENADASLYYAEARTELRFFGQLSRSRDLR